MPKSRGRAPAKRRGSSPRTTRPSAPTRTLGKTPETAKPTNLTTFEWPHDEHRPWSAPQAPRSGAPQATADADRAQMSKGGRDSGALHAESFACEPLQQADPQSLVLTYWFEAAATGDPYVLILRIEGQWLGPPGPDDERETSPRPGNIRFTLTRRIEVQPGTGRIALTTRIPQLKPGQWTARATPVAEEHPHRADPEAQRPRPAETRYTVRTTGWTLYGPVAGVRAPGAKMGAWPALVTAGAAVGLMTQWFLASLYGLPTMRILVISLIGCLIGLVGAKAYYLVTHRTEKRPLLTAGMCIQGFVIAAVAAIVVGSFTVAVPLGVILDVSTPGLLFGMSIGRLGCFLGGCCAGRPSASRWAIWSSDRTMGVRRIPVQLIESAAAAAIGAGALVIVAWVKPDIAGTVFVVGMSANILLRQMLFPLRVVPRSTRHGRTLAATLSALAFTASVVAAFL